MSTPNKIKTYNLLYGGGNIMKPLKERISITIDGDLLEKLRFQAEYDDRSLSQYINIILKEHIKNLESKK